MTLAELKAAIQSIVDDDDFNGDLTAMINEAILKVATGDMLPGRYELTPPLPDLYATSTVDTVVGAGITDLPTDYNRGLFQVVNSDDDNIYINPSFKGFLKRYTEIETGDVFGVAVHGSRLLYRDTPATAETLIIHYYEKPTTLSGDSDEPTCIPGHLQRKLIVHQVCKEIYDQIEDGIEGQKINTAHHERMYQQGLMDLELWAGAEKEPDYIETFGDYCD